MPKIIDKLYNVIVEGGTVSTDSRKITPGCIFFGLKGGNVDGSAFGAAAINAGAAFAVVRFGAGPVVDGVLEVADPLGMLQHLAQHHRKQLSIPVIAITGSNGKTTTKELMHRMLSSAFAATATRGNLNNHIGVPLTLLSVSHRDDLAIVEMGANHPGEIRMLCDLAEPTHGLVTNIGKAHLEGFGGLIGVKKAKSELYDHLAAHSGIAFINVDELYLTELSHAVSHRIFYRFAKTPSFSERNIEFVSSDSPDSHTVSFRDANAKEWVLRSNLFGKFNLANIATAIAVALHFNVPGDNICNAVSTYHPENNRAQRIVKGSNTWILDAYNANPTSMASAIRSFEAIAHPNKLIILGAMMELGEYSDDEHRNILNLANSAKATRVICVGGPFRALAQEAGVEWFADTELLTGALKSQGIDDSLILVKGSRAIQLERVLAAFE